MKKNTRVEDKRCQNYKPGLMDSISYELDKQVQLKLQIILPIISQHFLTMI